MRQLGIKKQAAIAMSESLILCIAIFEECFRRIVNDLFIVPWIIDKFGRVGIAKQVGIFDQHFPYHFIGFQKVAICFRKISMNRLLITFLLFQNPHWWSYECDQKGIVWDDYSEFYVYCRTESGVMKSSSYLASAPCWIIPPIKFDTVWNKAICIRMKV